jgi:uncharacterized protein (UPF0128 family)
MKPTPEQLALFDHLRNSQIHAYFKNLLEEKRDMLEVTKEHEAVLINQGGIAQIRSILKLIEGNGQQAPSP